MNQSLQNALDEYVQQKQYRLINSILVYQENELIAERYYNNFTRDSRNNIKSIWKSILSICTGVCLDKGLIGSLDDRISEYLPEFSQDLHPYHKMITVRHLLTMTSGIYWNGGVHYHCPMYHQIIHSKRWLDYLADIALADVPGTRFLYKEWDVMLLSALIAKAADCNTYDFCNEYLYHPLGIQSGRWWQSECGVVYNIGTNNLEEETSNLSATDLAKIGMLFMNDGIWNQKQVLSKDYIQQAISSSPHAPNYGFLWWRIENGYGCRGYGGQEINVLPDSRTVFVLQAKATPSCKSYGDVFNELVLNHISKNMAV